MFSSQFRKTQFSCLIICTTDQLKPTSPELVQLEESFFVVYNSPMPRVLQMSREQKGLKNLDDEHGPVGNLACCLIPQRTHL